MYTWLATAAFGLEGIVKRELTDLGMNNVRTELGAVRFEGSMTDAFKANLWLRAADRVLLLVGEQKVTTFEELFQFVRSIPWENYLQKDAEFPVSGKCARSALMSVRDCQSITKKAIVERLKEKYQTAWFEENGSKYAIDVSIHSDMARITLDTSGLALNKRGYRTWTGEAPIRETLAAALLMISHWKKAETPLYDPCCGTGTFLIEGAFLQSNRAPGLTRDFAMESWKFDRFDPSARADAQTAFHPENIHDICGSDVDQNAIELCKKHIKQAGISNKILVSVQDFRDLTRADAPFFIANPPYGERMSDRKNCEMLYRYMGKLWQRHPDSNMGVITSHAGFERCFGRRATQKRRLYNGRLECEYMLFSRHS